LYNNDYPDFGVIEMENQEKIKLKIIMSLDGGATLRELESQRIKLCDYLTSGLVLQADIKQPSPSRSLDPAVIGAIGLAISPIAIQKLGDLIIKWTELRKDCSITITIPIKGKESIAVSYNPKSTSPETLKKWIATAVESSKRK
jgi:hypothetical protein